MRKGTRTMDWEGVVLIQVKAWEGLGDVCVHACVCVRWWGVGLREADSTRFKAGWHQQKTGFEDSAPNSNALFLVSISEHPSGVRG